MMISNFRRNSAVGRCLVAISRKQFLWIKMVRLKDRIDRCLLLTTGSTSCRGSGWFSVVFRFPVGTTCGHGGWRRRSTFAFFFHALSPSCHFRFRTGAVSVSKEITKDIADLFSGAAGRCSDPSAMFLGELDETSRWTDLFDHVEDSSDNLRFLRLGVGVGIFLQQAGGDGFESLATGSVLGVSVSTNHHRVWPRLKVERKKGWVFSFAFSGCSLPFGWLL